MNDNNEKLILGLIIAAGIVLILMLILNERSIYKELDNEYYVSLDVGYCNGKQDTVYLQIKGHPQYLHIVNQTRRKHYQMAVPELHALEPTDGCENGVLLLNVCTFNIIHSEKIIK